ncbi:MAG: Gfo/Idh/MocA family protein [Chthoniobacteraceae bacterium]
MSGERKVHIGIYGANGHQIHEALSNHSRACLVAVAGFPREKLPSKLRAEAGICFYPSLEDMLNDSRVELVSLCSPRRCDQADDAIKVLRAGKNVYAEKPCAMEEAEMDEILRVAGETGCHFHEMADTAFMYPYDSIRQIVRDGTLGRVIQVIAEKSYPYKDWRPQDEMVDGGLIRQCAVHAFRFIEHVANVKICSVQSIETTAGDPKNGNLRMAASFLLGLEEGAIASVAANYLNPSGSGIWGYETLRILGEKGMVESTQGGQHTRLVIGGQDKGKLEKVAQRVDYLDAYVQTLLGDGEMPLTTDEELSPTRWVIRAKNSCVIHGNNAEPFQLL